MKERKRTIWYIEMGLFAVLLVIYAVVMYQLFYQQCISDGSTYISDMEAYLLEAQGQNSGYELPYPIFFGFAGLLGKLMDINIATSVALTIMNTAAVGVLAYYIVKLVNKALISERSKRFVLPLSCITALLLFFTSMTFPRWNIIIPGMDFRYLGVFSPNPYHNATYMATRLFAIICFFSAACVLEQYETKWNTKDNIIFSTNLLLTTLTKPSFTFILVPTVGLIMLYRLIRTKGKNWNGTWKTVLLFIPTFIDLLYQYWGVFGEKHGSETGIGFEIAKAWSVYNHNIPVAILLGLAFPIIVLIFNWKELKQKNWYLLSWQLMLFSLLTFLCLYEKGDRFGHMNFSWGYMHGLFFTYVASVILLIQNTLQTKKPIIGLLLQWGVFGIHVICGIKFFLFIYQGGAYFVY